MRACRTLLILTLLAATHARADLVISDKPTSHMSCTGGICQPTEKNAVLNAGDLADMLAGGDVKVETTTLTPVIALAARLSWTSASTLTLAPAASVLFDKPLVVAGPGGLTILGELFFPVAGAHVEFRDKTSVLTINGNRYVLAASFRALQHLAGRAQFVALVKSVNAPKAVFAASPITSFGSNGVIEGLGNTISRLSIDDETSNDPIGLIGTLESGAVVSNISLSGVSVRGAGAEKATGSLAGENFGEIVGSSATGAVSASGTASYAGGLVGRNDRGAGGSGTGEIVRSYTDVAVSIDGTAFLEGGLVGLNAGVISGCYATGTVVGADDTTMGGLAGLNSSGSLIGYSFATGAVTGGDAATVGGMAGGNGTDGTAQTIIFNSYSAGAVSGGPHAIVGGIIGADSANASNARAYWDLDLSGVTDPGRGAGNIANDPGLTGLSTAEFQSGLPKGLSRNIWTETPGINGGLPYLRDVPRP